VAVVEGDQETRLDAERIRRTGCSVVPADGCLLFVENVGNLVCPALFDLGEDAKVVIVSVTEGTDKPLKYPYMFAAADLVVVNKVDLLPYVDFDLDACRGHVRSVNPRASVAALSATRGDNVGSWYDWLAIS
jgi:hydrogenase nickel incorporation protein HypB